MILPRPSVPFRPAPFRRPEVRPARDWHCHVRYGFHPRRGSAVPSLPAPWESMPDLWATSPKAWANCPKGRERMPKGWESIPKPWARFPKPWENILNRWAICPKVWASFSKGHPCFPESRTYCFEAPPSLSKGCPARTGLWESKAKSRGCFPKVRGSHSGVPASGTGPWQNDFAAHSGSPTGSAKRRRKSFPPAGRR